MIATLILLAQEEDEVPVGWLTPNAKEALTVLGALFVIILIATVCIFVFRKRRRRHSHLHHRSSQLAGGAQPGAAVDQGHGRRRRHRGHRHHDKYSNRNPTLAETGGLPPKREGSSIIPAPPPAPPQQA